MLWKFLTTSWDCERPPRPLVGEKILTFFKRCIGMYCSSKSSWISKIDLYYHGKQGRKMNLLVVFTFICFLHEFIAEYPPTVFFSELDIFLTEDAECKLALSHWPVLPRAGGEKINFVFYFFVPLANVISKASSRGKIVFLLFSFFWYHHILVPRAGGEKINFWTNAGFVICFRISCFFRSISNTSKVLLQIIVIFSSHINDNHSWPTFLEDTSITVAQFEIEISWWNI